MSVGESLSRVSGLGTGTDLGAFDSLAVGGGWRLKVEDTARGVKGTR
jgi:subtilisin-like proprotein convertase family protein